MYQLPKSFALSIKYHILVEKLKKMALTIRANHILQNITGDGKNSWLRHHLVVQTVFTLAILSLPLSSSVSFVLNIGENLIVASTSFISALGFLLWIGIYSHFLISRKRFYSLFEDVEEVVNESVCSTTDH